MTSETARCVTSVTDVWADPAVEAVVVATPTPTHEEIVRQALDSGRHVLSEKPLTYSSDTDFELDALARQRSRVLAVGFWRRTCWPFGAAKKLLTEGAIGEPQLIRSCQWDAYLPPIAFCATSGGLELDCGIHEFDLLAWLFETHISRVAAAAPPARELAALGDVETAVAIAVMASGHVATVDLTRSVRYADDVRTEITGTEGAILISTLFGGRVTIGTASGLAGVPPPRQRWATDILADALVSQLEAFAAACRGESNSIIAPPSAAAAALNASVAMRHSRVHGGWFDVAPPSEKPVHHAPPREEHFAVADPTGARTRLS